MELVIYKWDEEKLVSDIKKAPSNSLTSYYLLTEPRYDYWREARKRYEASLLEDFRHATKQSPTVTEDDSLLKKSGSQIVEKGKDNLASTSGENKK
ncbi:unnamed protein product [Arabidopsis thaliana]|uniref:Uncharacterized protein n=1 Tax=Arabidopsis thaliana TaxID=3702 RepID=A0A5S9X6K3_ARATH|nr:unnamed protein product [Arabidopsis thaliana]